MKRTLGGAGFRLEVPSGASDNSIYCVTFPELGTLPPSLTVHISDVPERPDLVQALRDVAEALCEDEWESVGGRVTGGTRGSWSYAVTSIEWGEAESRMKQKHLLIHVPGAVQRLFTVVGTDYVGNFGRSEPVFDEIIRSLSIDAPD